MGAGSSPSPIPPLVGTLKVRIVMDVWPSKRKGYFRVVIFMNIKTRGSVPSQVQPNRTYINHLEPLLTPSYHINIFHKLKFALNFINKPQTVI